MKTEVADEVKKGTAQTRAAFVSACCEAEKIRSEMPAVRLRIEAKTKAEACAREKAEALRKELEPAVEKLSREIKREHSERVAYNARLDELVQAALNSSDRELRNKAFNWKASIDRAVAVGRWSEGRRLEVENPFRSELPEVKPVGENVEKEGLDAAQRLAAAMNDCAIAVADRRRCQVELSELVDRLEAAEEKMLALRDEYEKDFNDSVRNYEARLKAAAKERENRIKALKAARDSSVAELKAMGIDG